jgi:hypothetical protein
VVEEVVEVVVEEMAQVQAALEPTHYPPIRHRHMPKVRLRARKVQYIP